MPAALQQDNAGIVGAAMATLTAGTELPGPAGHGPAGHAADRRAAGHVLGAAFQVEPVYVWLFPRSGAAPAPAPAPDHDDGGAPARGGLGVAQVAEVAGAVAGAAVWDAPGKVEPGVRRMSAGRPGMFRATGRRLPDLARLGAMLDGARPTVPHWYLFHLGTAPDLQLACTASARR